MSEACRKVQADAPAWRVSRICSPETQHLEEESASRYPRRLGEPYIWEEVCRFQSRPQCRSSAASRHLSRESRTHGFGQVRRPFRRCTQPSPQIHPYSGPWRFRVRYCYIVINNESVRCHGCTLLLRFLNFLIFTRSRTGLSSNSSSTTYPPSSVRKRNHKPVVAIQLDRQQLNPGLQVINIHTGGNGWLFRIAHLAFIEDRKLNRSHGLGEAAPGSQGSPCRCPLPQVPAFVRQNSPVEGVLPS